MDKKASFTFGKVEGFGSGGRGGSAFGERGVFDSGDRGGFSFGGSGGSESQQTGNFNFGAKGVFDSGGSGGLNFGRKGLFDSGESKSFNFGVQRGSGFGVTGGVNSGETGSSDSGGREGFNFGGRGVSHFGVNESFKFGGFGGSYSGERGAFNIGEKGVSNFGVKEGFNFGESGGTAFGARGGFNIGGNRADDAGERGFVFGGRRDEESDTDDSDETDLDSLSDDEPEQDAEKVFNHMFKTVLNHEKNWSYAGTTLLVYWVSGQDPKVIRSVKRHSEQTLIKRLSELYKKELMRVKVYINNSPCEYCARMLIEFLTRKRQLQLTIYVASLYMIKRRSCIAKRESHVNGLKQMTSDKNTRGLKKLMDHRRCKVKSFNEKIWKELLDALDIKGKKFEEVYQTRADENDRSRKEEDLYIKEDLKQIDDEEEEEEEEED